MEIPEWFTTPELQAAYLCTEGVRIAALSDEATSALPYFEKVLEIDSLHADAHYQLSRYYASRNSKKALEHIEIALAADSANVDYLTQHCMALAGEKRFQEAKVSSTKLIALNPKNPAYYHTTALLYEYTNMPYMAISVLDSAEVKLGYNEELANLKRSLLIRVGQYDRAIEELQSVIANRPMEVENLVMLGNLYSYLGRDSLAEAAYDRALEVSPESVEVLGAQIAHLLDSKNEAKLLASIKKLFLSDGATLEQKLKIYDDHVVANEDFYRRNFFTINSLASTLYVKHPNDYSAASRYATHLIRAGELDRALGEYKRWAAAPSTPLDALLVVVDIEKYKGRRDSVLHYLDIAIERNPQMSDLHLRKAYEYMDDPTPEGRKMVVGSLKKAIEVAPDSLSKSNANASLGDILVDENPKKGYRYYRRALDLNPDNAQALNNWAYHLCENGGDLQQALRMSTRACELTPSNANNLDTKAWILHRMGRNDEAKPIMMRAISLDKSGEPTFLLHYADILAAEGEVFMAEIYYRRALEAGEDEKLIELKINQLKQPKGEDN